MFSDSALRPDEFRAPIGGELLEGLMLMRASTLKMIRLQLAIERHDRRAALEAVDDLVALDRRLEDCLGGVSLTGDQLSLRCALNADRFALNHEKLALGAEVRLHSPAPVEETGPFKDDDGLARPPGLESRWNHLWLAIAAVLIVCLAAAAYVIVVPGATARLAEAAGALR